jgi:hypothetical protein
MYVDVCSVRKDIDNPGANWEPCSTLTVGVCRTKTLQVVTFSNMHVGGAGADAVART